MFTVLFRHPDFVVLNKMAGVSVHRDDAETAFTAEVARVLGVERVWLVHRLDKPTSGILLLALNATAAVELAQQFAQREVGKTYLALSTHKPQKKQGWIQGDMVKARRGAWKLTRSQHHPAITYFTSQSLQAHLRLFILQPHTGKTHQLRVAMKSLGSPILGDELYGGETAERLFLHAWRLQLSYHNTSFDWIAPLEQVWHRFPLPSEISALHGEQK